MNKTPEQIAEELTQETPQHHIKADGELCSSLLVDASEDPCDLECDCGLNNLITQALHNQRVEGGQEIVDAVENHEKCYACREPDYASGCKCELKMLDSAKQKLNEMKLC